MTKASIWDNLQFKIYNLKFTIMKTTIKPLLILALVTLLGSNSNIAQNVGIGAESFTPHESAMLEVKSTEKGLLPPRMTTEQRDLIQNPATGLLIFNTTNNCIEVFAYGIWQQMFCAVCPVPNAPSAGTHTPSETQIIWNWNSVSGAIGYKWHTTNNYATATDLGSTTTVTQTGLNICTAYTIYVWAYNACGNSTVLNLNSTTTGNVPSAPTASTHTPSETAIIWIWNASAGATGYKWHTENNYAVANDLGNTTTVTQTELTCNTSNTIFVWAYNECGNSSVLTLTQTTSACPICDVPSVTFTYKGQQVTYGTVESSGKCWLDRNLGATVVATSSTHTAAYGDLFQWGRRDDGHQTRTSGITTTTSSTDQPGHSLHIVNTTSASQNYDWRIPQNANLWQGVEGINNPCPAGWRVPTSAEWDTERLNWATNNNSSGAMNSPLKLPLAGYRRGTFADGNVAYTGEWGWYWASDPSNGFSGYLNFTVDNANVSTHRRSNGLSIRCIKD